ncbi:KICSTOR complex protein ITFG2-like [Lineus longissimus]|uniref:KICSTOR complex protein ITFG2-like n=1 Tax=Lineus longissimus TaxID=88925 RepID=UPI002B4D1D37
MRTVCFVDRLELDCPGNLFNQALAIGDVDNDKGNEVVVGNVTGQMRVFKLTDSRPWGYCSDLGMITCIGVGDICNLGRNFIVCLTAEGKCHIFDLRSLANEVPNSDSKEKEKETMDDISASYQMKPTFTQQLEANSRVMLLGDLNSDGKMALVIGYSDRAVRQFQWQESEDEDASSVLGGKIVQIERWQLAGQIGSITLNASPDGIQELMVAQPGGTFVTLIKTNDKKPKESPPSPTGTTKPPSPGSPTHVCPSLVYHPLGSSMARNNCVSSEVVGGIRRAKSESTQTFYAVATLDGTVMMIENDKILWSLQVDHQLFGLSKLDITGNQNDEVIVCSWDGQTYIVDHGREVVRFHFDENVAAFAAGHFALTDQQNIPCLIYVTFSNKMYIYYDITMPQVHTTNLIKTMEKEKELPDILACLNVDGSNQSEVREFYHWCLYGNMQRIHDT